MSGGSHNYAFGYVADFDATKRRNNPLRRAFNKHLAKVAEAMRLIEWVDSNDNSPGDEDAAIRACLAPDAEVRAAAEVAEVAAEQLRNALAEYEARR